MKAPVVMVGYTRFRKLSESLDRLAECIGAQERDVHLFLDAPRRAEDATACEAMRRVAEWKRKTVLPRLHIFQRERNYGVPGNIKAACRMLMEEWWDEYRLRIHRDQPALAYVLHRAGISFDRITTLGGNVFWDPSFRILEHARAGLQKRSLR